MRKPIIVGLDPGNITAYAILGINGGLVAISHSRYYNVSSIISEVVKFGRPIIISTDRKKCPNFVKAVAGNLGSRLFTPKEDLSNVKKIKLVDTFLKFQKEFIEIENKHERDALAAALSAFRNVKPLLKKIEDGIKNKDKAEKVKEVVLVNNVPIAEALKEV